MTLSRARSSLLAGAAFLLLALPTAVEAQARRPSGPERPGRPRALEIGARLGLDTSNDAFILGAQMRLPIDPWKRIEILPGGWVDFLDRVTEYQLDADVALMFDSRGAFYGGGGAAFRNTIYDAQLGEEGEVLGEREFKTGYNLFLGLRSPPSRGGGLAGQIELRWVSVEQFDVQTITVGVNWPVVIF